MPLIESGADGIFAGKKISVPRGAKVSSPKQRAQSTVQYAKGLMMNRMTKMYRSKHG